MPLQILNMAPTLGITCLYLLASLVLSAGCAQAIGRLSGVDESLRLLCLPEQPPEQVQYLGKVDAAGMEGVQQLAGHSA